MSTLILQSVLLLFAAFMVPASLGWLLAGPGKRKVAEQPRAVFFEPEVVAEAAPVVAAVAAAPVMATIVPELEPAPETVVEPVVEAVAEATPVVVPEDMPEDVVATVEDTAPVAATDDMDQVVKQFTSGVIVPFKMPDNSGQSAYDPPSVTPKLDMVAAPVTQPVVVPNVSITREDNSLQRRVSSLAGMTPESIEAAVQQVGSGLEPVRLSAPQGKPDDLTVISGVAESNQRELNALGIYHYWQIAGWSPEHVAWISNRILFPRRVVRENWMSQAARLAKLT